MGEQVIRHEIACDEDEFWKCVFDEEHNRRLYLDVLRFRRFETLEQESVGETTRRKLFLDPPAIDLPAPIAKVVGDLSYVEEGTYDRRTGRYRFRVTPSSQPEKTKIEGELWCEPRGPKRVERIARTSVEVKIFMIGSLIEKRIFEDMRKSFDAGAGFTGQYAAETFR